jgi:hypothetical protein
MGDKSHRITHGWYKFPVARRVFYFILEKDGEVALEKLVCGYVSWRHAWNDARLGSTGGSHARSC